MLDEFSVGGEDEIGTAFGGWQLQYEGFGPNLGQGTFGEEYARDISIYGGNPSSNRSFDGAPALSHPPVHLRFEEKAAVFAMQGGVNDSMHLMSLCPSTPAPAAEDQLPSEYHAANKQASYLHPAAIVPGFRVRRRSAFDIDQLLNWESDIADPGTTTCAFTEDTPTVGVGAAGPGVMESSHSLDGTIGPICPISSFMFINDGSATRKPPAKRKRPASNSLVRQVGKRLSTSVPDPVRSSNPSITNLPKSHPPRIATSPPNAATRSQAERYCGQPVAGQTIVTLGPSAREGTHGDGDDEDDALPSSVDDSSGDSEFTPHSANSRPRSRSRKTTRTPKKARAASAASSSSKPQEEKRKVSTDTREASPSSSSKTRTKMDTDARRENNRQAAQRSREKKSARLKLLAEENQELKVEIKRLREKLGERNAGAALPGSGKIIGA
ncbi:hypothetical protein HK101_006011 [Irineochytrium annulatum]|nr:hypothetical protein HK101_006011 [Irineochytrium annulatum]